MANKKYDEDKAFERVMQACAAAETKGWKIAQGTFLRREYGDSLCCPMGAFLVEAASEVPLPHKVSTMSDQKKISKLFRDETGVGAVALSPFVRVIDGLASEEDRKSRSGLLARRVRAALWGEA